MPWQTAVVGIPDHGWRFSVFAPTPPLVCAAQTLAAWRVKLLSGFKRAFHLKHNQGLLDGKGVLLCGLCPRAAHGQGGGTPMGRS